MAKKNKKRRPASSNDAAVKVLLIAILAVIITVIATVAAFVMTSGENPSPIIGVPKEEETTEEATTEAVTEPSVPPVTSITVATYNIRHGEDVDLDWSKLAEIILQSGADIIGLQEVDMGTRRVQGMDTMAGLAEATGYPYYFFAPAMDYDNGQYGTAILSRYPIASAKKVQLNSGSYEPRAFGAVTVTLEDNSSLLFLNTHLSYEDVFVQSTQFTQIIKWINRNEATKMPVILTGDFNTSDFTVFDGLTDLGFSLINNAEHSYPTFRGSSTPIDNIVYLTSYLTPAEHGMIDSDRSDHNLLWCRFDLHR